MKDERIESTSTKYESYTHTYVNVVVVVEHVSTV
jgi:hypothetical protein